MLCAAPYGADAVADPGDPGPKDAPLRGAIRAEFERHDARIGYGCPSAGPGMIFAEEMLDRGGELHLVLPCPPDEFVAQHVAPAGGDWTARFAQVRVGAERVEVSCEERLRGDETVLRFNNQMLQGMARLHAERIGARARLMALWSPGAPGLPGSPADFIDQWPELEHLSLVDLDELGGSVQPAPHDDLSDAFGALSIGISPLVVRAIFFADLATYTTIRDEDVPLLWDFLAEVQHQVEQRAKAPILINSWGDAVHAAAETATDLAGYATALVESTARLDLAGFGLEKRPRFRVALHAGPVYVGLHPLTGRSMVFGHHVNRAARIEAIAAPGEIFASQHFVALLKAEMDARLHESQQEGEAYEAAYGVEYLGTMELPKNFGREAIYRIQPAPGAVEQCAGSRG
jgi:class 3 adenylate cyclase